MKAIIIPASKSAMATYGLMILAGALLAILVSKKATAPESASDWWTPQPILPIRWKPAFAADLTQIERKIKKEPNYQSKDPRYGSLVLGPNAEQRIWLVIDRDTLYVDLNGNGDLTEPGERIKTATCREGGGSFEVSIPGANADQTRTLSVNRIGSTQEFHMDLSAPGFPSFGAWGDANGRLHFASRPQDAPIIRFEGPLQMGFECQLPLMKKDKGIYELNVGVGTKGVGNGSFAHVRYWNDAVPHNVAPTAVLEFPNKTQGGPPIRVETILKHRC